MVTSEELAAIKFVEHKEVKCSAFVTDSELSRFSGNRNLSEMVYQKVTKYAKENNIKNKYESMIDVCQISDTSLKKSCTGTQRITRTFLYKLAVGLKMSVEEADELFALCGGMLSRDNLEDYICIKALEDKDDIMVFIDQFNHYIKKYNISQKDKLTTVFTTRKPPTKKS